MAGDYGSTRVTKAPRGSMKRNDSAGGEQANDDLLLAQTQPCISIPHAITDIALPTFPFSLPQASDLHTPTRRPLVTPSMAANPTMTRAISALLLDLRSWQTSEPASLSPPIDLDDRVCLHICINRTVILRTSVTTPTDGCPTRVPSRV
jgi:hypothetical protein